MTTLAALGLERIGLTEILIVLLVVLLLFGARKLPDLARSLGRSLGEFKKGREEGEQMTRRDRDAPREDADRPDAKPRP